MNKLQIFKNSDFGEIRTVTIDNEPWFVATDVCRALEIKNATDAVKRLDEDEVTRFNLGGLSGESNCVNEYGLYNLVLGSRKPEAKQFKRWITHEVIPQIRKTGAYIPDLSALSPELQLLNVMVAQINKDAIQIAQLQEASSRTAEQIEQTKQEIQDMRDAIIINPKAEWRKEVDSILKKIGFKADDYSAVRREAYQALQDRARCKPNVLVTNLKKRAAANGMQKSKVDNINLMDVLENDVRLREIFISIVKEMRIKWGV